VLKTYSKKKKSWELTYNGSNSQRANQRVNRVFLCFSFLFFFLNTKTLSKPRWNQTPKPFRLLHCLFLFFYTHKFLQNPLQCFFLWIEEIYKKERERERERERVRAGFVGPLMRTRVRDVRPYTLIPR
jgi:hypothetical protein